ncbi:hypothetical protein [Shimazuella kribbensis]|uniref:hypothetical protein n=1 Tax=Shimazuella kribbensis TaxID=139808 RepID=UPI00041C89C2|nr:hypothetical protein [Shimazuella kribbensis]
MAKNKKQKSKPANKPASQAKFTEYEFKQSVFFPWIKVKIRFDSDKMYVLRRKYFLGTVPLNQVELTFPYNRITNIVPYAKLQLIELVIGMVLLLADLSIIANSFGYEVPLGFISIFLFFPLHIMSAYFLSAAFSYKLYIVDVSKKRKAIDISRKEKERLQEMLGILDQTMNK